MSTPTPSPTAPLSPAASAALARLELRFAPVFAEQLRVERLASGLRAGESMVINGSRVTAVPLAVAEAVADYRAAEARANALIRSAQAAPMSDLDADDLAHNVDLMTGYKATLAKAGRLDLIELDPDVQRAMVRHRICSETLAELDSRAIDTVPLFNELKNAQAGLAEARATLADAGMLHLIGGA